MTSLPRNAHWYNSGAEMAGNDYFLIRFKFHLLRRNPYPPAKNVWIDYFLSKTYQTSRNVCHKNYQDNTFLKRIVVNFIKEFKEDTNRCSMKIRKRSVAGINARVMPKKTQT